MATTPPPRPLPSSGPEPQRILVRGVSWLGDAVMTTPALFRLRERFPAAHVTLLTPEKLLDVWRCHPAVDESVGFAPGEGVLSVSRRLSRGRFDCALILPNSPRSALEAWLARIPRRVGYARPWRNWFLTQAIPTRPGHVPMRKRSAAEIRRLIRSPSQPTHNSQLITPNFFRAHQIHEYLYLFAAALGASPEPLPPQVVVQPPEIDEAVRKFDLAGITQPVLGLNPGAEYGPAKRWPAERFIAAAREIQERTNCVWVLLGGVSEIADNEKIRLALRTSRFAPRNLAGRTTLRELCALLKFCRALLTNDSGPMHVAAALGTPVAVPFGSTSPAFTGPGLPGDARHRVLVSGVPCSPCFLRRCPIDFRCMTGIGVDQVVAAVMAALKR